jgi:drug/metabolite transporter (DMT)-like permease
MEASRAADLGIADPRLLWRLAHRPLWVAGIVADGVSALLHVVALSFGPITLVQPLGVTGLLFAMPIVAVLRRQRISARDLSAALVVLAALSLLLFLLPTAGSARVGTSLDLAGLLVTMLVFDAVAVAIAAVTPPRVRSLTLAAGAGASFGIAAVLVRALLEMREQPHSVASVVVSAVGIGLLIPVGYLLLQNAYRWGHFSGSLATAVVADPIAAVLGGAWVLNERLPTLPWQIVSSVACAGLVIAGIVVLVRSPSHLLDLDESDPPFSGVAADQHDACGDDDHRGVREEDPEPGPGSERPRIDPDLIESAAGGSAQIGGEVVLPVLREDAHPPGQHQPKTDKDSDAAGR